MFLKPKQNNYSLGGPLIAKIPYLVKKIFLRATMSDLSHFQQNLATGHPKPTWDA